MSVVAPVAPAHGEPPPDGLAAELKRKRTQSDPPSAPQKTQKVANAHLAINYLARQYQDDLPLISTDDALTSILSLLGEYQGVLERHESMACNLGARPLGPILIKRFERLFDGPPKILKNHGKEGNTVSWLDVVEFARSKPEQFVLGQMSEGVSVCQIHTKQCRVQISEEDFMLIHSGMPQKLIPPQPIVEDEEKELGTLEILDKQLTSISHLADQVAARTRQLKHRINGRRQAILERRANEPGAVIRGTSPSVLNGSGVANAHSHNSSNGRPAEFSKTGASAATKNELMSKFFTQAEKERREGAHANGDVSNYTPGGTTQVTHNPAAPVQQQSNANNYRDIHPRESSSYNGYNAQTPDRNSLGANRPRQTSSGSANTYGDNIAVHAFSLPQPTSTAGVLKEVRPENDGPYRAEMVTRMEALKKGDRVLPPCDRCRRLHMDCIKNLTACAGCTKKHAKCSWRDVRESELWGPDKGKVPIPPAQELDRERDREPSVGLRPSHSHSDHNTSSASTSSSNVHLLQNFNAAPVLDPHLHPTQQNRPTSPYSRDPRALALEGLTAAEAHHHGHAQVTAPPPTGSEYHSPSTPQPQPHSGYPSRPPSSGPHGHALPTLGHHAGAAGGVSYEGQQQRHDLVVDRVLEG